MLPSRSVCTQISPSTSHNRSQNLSLHPPWGSSDFSGFLQAMGPKYRLISRLFGQREREVKERCQSDHFKGKVRNEWLSWFGSSFIYSIRSID